MNVKQALLIGKASGYKTFGECMMRIRMNFPYKEILECNIDLFSQNRCISSTTSLDNALKILDTA